eukprot:3837618-Prymnesium_polylepis.2
MVKSKADLQRKAAAMELAQAKRVHTAKSSNQFREAHSSRAHTLSHPLPALPWHANVSLALAQGQADARGQVGARKPARGAPG